MTDNFFMRSKEKPVLQINIITRSGFYLVLTFLVNFGVSCQPQQAGTKQASPPKLPGEEFKWQTETSQISEPVGLSSLQPTTSPASAGGGRIVEQAAPVTYTWKAIELPQSSPADSLPPGETTEKWASMQPVVIFPDNSTVRPGQRSGLNEPPVEVEQRSVKALNNDQLILFDKLQDKILKLMLALRQAEERNINMQQSLVEAQSAVRLAQEELNRKLIQIDMDKSEIADLNERLAKVSSASQASTQPASATQPVDEMDAAQLRRRIERLKLQLQLANMQGPDKVRQLSEKLAEMAERFSDMEDIHVRLSHLVVVQADQIKALQAERRALQIAAMTEFDAAKVAAKTEGQAGAKPGIIIGQIKTVNGQKIVIDMGSKNGLEKGMRMIVFRGDKFIGYLRMDEIGQAESSGTIVRQVLEPKVGDKVIDKLQ